MVITENNAADIAHNGMTFSPTPPPGLASTLETPYGRANYALVPSTQGQVVSVGYDGPGRACLVFAVGMPSAPVEKRLKELFDIPGTWRSVPPQPAAEGERKLEWRWDLTNPEEHITALVSIRSLPSSPDGAFIMVTIANTGK